MIDNSTTNWPGCKEMQKLEIEGQINKIFARNGRKILKISLREEDLKKLKVNDKVSLKLKKGK